MKNESEWDGAVLRDLSSDWAERVVFFPQCGSTNDEACELATKGAGDWTVVLTERQGAGRGRRGQRWFSPPGEGLAFSMVVRPQGPAALWSRLALSAGLAVAEGLEVFGVSAGLKWPNDVRVGGRKISGILVESGSGFLVVGVGVNVNVTRFPEGLEFPATSLALETGRMERREAVLVSCLDRLRLRLRQSEEEFEAVRQAWSERCVLTGKVVTMDVGGQRKTGTVEGLAANGELLLRGSDGLERILQADLIREGDSR